VKSNLSVNSVAVLAVMTALLGWTVPALSDAVEGKQYTLLKPEQTPEISGKTEVIEFFSYGCPHCWHFHPYVDKLATELPATAILVRIPVSLGRPQWGQLSRAFYALQATGDLKRLDGELFDAIHQEQQPLFNEANITAWVSAHGVDAAKFTAAFNSFAVTTKAAHAEELSRTYQVDGIPKLVVAGKYVVEGSTLEELAVNAKEIVATVAAPPGNKTSK
jgi:thiol:disulfide interchange protein DsbA